jgi:NTE family protein
MAIRRLFHQRGTLRAVPASQPKTAFVFSGGGNLGAIQVGQLRALIERGIVPDAVIGCSVGALNGAAIAANPTLEEVDRITEIWHHVARSDIFPSTGRGRGPWLYLRHAASAYGDHGLRRLIHQFLRFTRFEDAAVKFSVVATSLAEGVEHWFESGDVLLPLLASTALPGVFPPVDIDGTTYIDGGVVNNVPVSKAFEMNAKRVYVLDTTNVERQRPDPKRPYDVLMQAVSIARSHRFRSDCDRVPEGTDLIRMPSIDVGKLRFDDFSRSPELIRRAYEASRAFLDSLQPAPVQAEAV